MQCIYIFYLHYIRFKEKYAMKETFLKKKIICIGMTKLSETASVFS